MSLREKYSPPYTVTIFPGEDDEQRLSFKRMIRSEWRAMAEEMKTELIEAENAKITADMKDAPLSDKQIVRTRMRDYFELAITQGRIIQESANTPKGIERLLQFALIEKDKKEWLDLIDAPTSDEIVTQIVMMPTVKPADPSKLPPSPSEASSGGSENSSTNPIGIDTTPTSNLPSPESTPTA